MSGAQGSKRTKDLSSDLFSKRKKKDRRDGNYANPGGPERMDTSYSEVTATSPSIDQMPSTQVTPDLWLAENDIEVEVDLNAKASKKVGNLSQTGIPDVLKAEIALRNTNGGVIKLKMKTNLSPDIKVKKIDQWLLNLNAKRKEKFKPLGRKEKLAEIIDFRQEDLLIFVKKSSIILTEKSNLFERLGSQKYELQSYFEIRNMLNNNEPRCCCTNVPPPIASFTVGQRLNFGESVTVEFKQLTCENLPDRVRKELREYIPQFANTSGGYVCFGISDDAIIKGQTIRNDEVKDHICSKIADCMNTKIWIDKCGKKEKPVCGTHYRVDFSPINGAEASRYVIVVHICRYAGTVFVEEPLCNVINEDNQFDVMSFEKWLSAFLKPNTCATGNEDYRERRVKQDRRTPIYVSVKDTAKQFVEKLKETSTGPLKLHPEHAVKWINHPALDRFVELTKDKFGESKWKSGIAFIEKCWEVNLGLASTKPDHVICDILLCCPQMPIVLVSLTQSAIPSKTLPSRLYNKKLATMLKTILAKEAGCLEKFYVKPITMSHEQLQEAGDLFAENDVYPNTYGMNNQKYSNILEALVFVLARANTMATHILGRGLYNMLTGEQYELLHDCFEECDKVKIRGPPGSGKTVLALERILRLRNGGCSRKEVLFLCAHKPLKAIVENKKTRNGEPLCIVKTYYDVDRLVNSNEAGFYRELGYVKHILADEVQHFQEDDSATSFFLWWEKLHMLCDDQPEESSFWVFFDIAQKINNNRSVSLRKFSGKKLKTIIRTTGNVHSFITSNCYMKVERDVKLGHNFKGPEVEVLVPSNDRNVDTDNHLMYILISWLHKLIIKDGNHQNHISVLFNNITKKNLWQDVFFKLTNHSCPVRTGEEVLRDGVVFDTIRRYSGVDNDIIVGFCPEYYTSGFQNNDALMTTLCSRTKFKLILIFEDAEQAESFKLTRNLTFVGFGNLDEVANFTRQ